jgi:NADH:ubiquinone oxidoreductase subunit K
MSIESMLLVVNLNLFGILYFVSLSDPKVFSFIHFVVAYRTEKDLLSDPEGR